MYRQSQTTQFPTAMSIQNLNLNIDRRTTMPCRSQDVFTNAPCPSWFLRVPQVLIAMLVTMLVVTSAKSTNAGLFVSDFDGVNDGTLAGLVSLGSGSPGTIDGANEWLVLTNDNDGQQATAYLPDLDPGSSASNFTARFRLNQSLGDDVDEADGAALFFGAFPDTTTVRNDNFGLTEGLRIQFQIENGSFGAVDEGITVHWDNVQIAQTQVDLTTDTISFHDLDVSVNIGGTLNINFDGSNVVSVAIPDWTDDTLGPQNGWQFAFAGRTGGRNAIQLVDDINFQTNLRQPCCWAWDFAAWS